VHSTREEVVILIACKNLDMILEVETGPMLIILNSNSKRLLNALVKIETDHSMRVKENIKI
jgi:hypothetical protein